MYSLTTAQQPLRAMWTSFHFRMIKYDILYDKLYSIYTLYISYMQRESWLQSILYWLIDYDRKILPPYSLSQVIICDLWLGAVIYFIPSITAISHYICYDFSILSNFLSKTLFTQHTDHITTHTTQHNHTTVLYRPGCNTLAIHTFTPAV